MGKKKRRIAVMIGSKSDLPQCFDGLQVLKQAEESDLAYDITVVVASIHRNTLDVHDYLRRFSDEGYDALIIGAGWANHLTGCSDAFLRYTLGDMKVVVIGVAFEDKKNLRHTETAVLSITEVPGTQVEFSGHTGSDGFLAACVFALDGELPEIRQPEGKPTVEMTLIEAIALADEKGGK